MRLFDKDNNGAQELNTLTGSYYAANNFANISSEIEFATREIASLVGAEVVKSASKTYQNGENTELVRHIQRAIACLAVCRYMTQTAVSHEDAGRKVKVDEGDKMPFEWMLDRDDRALREKYYRSLDALFGYLEEQDVAEWKNSRQRKILEESIVKTLFDFEKVYPIEGSYYTFFMLLPLIVEAQDTILKPKVGNGWTQLVQHHSAVASRVVILNAVCIAATRWSIEVFPLSVARRFSPTYQGNKASASATMAEMERYINSLRVQADDALNILLSELSGENRFEDYPLLPNNNKNKKYFTA